MKKICSVAMAFVLAAAMTVTAFAANVSPVEDVKVVEGSAKDKDGNVLTGDINDFVTVGEATQKAPEVVGQKLLASAEVKLENGAASATVVLSVVGVKKGETVLLKLFSNGRWETVEGVAIADNQVQVTVDKSGTLAVYVADETGNNGNGTGSTGTGSNGTGSTGTGSTGIGSKGTGSTGSGAGSATSPKTGETNAAAAAIMMAVVLAGAAIVAGKKVNA